MKGHKAQINSVTFSPSGNLLASSSSDKTVRLWLPNATGDNVILRGHSAPVRHVDFSPHNQARDDGSSALLLTCSDDKSVKVWILPHQKFQRSLIGHSNWVQCCKFSPDTPQLAASCGDDGSVRLWDIDRGSELTSYKDCRTEAINVIDFMSQGTALASGSSDGSVRLYDVRTDKILQYYPSTLTNGEVKSLSFHCSGNYLLSSGIGGVKIWDLRLGRLLHNVSEMNNDDESKFTRAGPFYANCATFSCDGTQLASSGYSGENHRKDILLWDYDSSHLMGMQGCHGCHGNYKMLGEKTVSHDRPSTAPLIQVCKTSTSCLSNEPVTSKLLNKTASRFHIDSQKCSPSSFVGDQSSHSHDVKVDFNKHSPSHDNEMQPPNSVQKYKDENVPHMLAKKMNFIIDQLRVVSQSLQIFDKRLAIQEDRLAQVLAEKANGKLLMEEGVTQTDAHGKKYGDKDDFTDLIEKVCTTSNGMNKDSANAQK